jgi:energy-coupling factor transporter ATP-binding protein EcfA2
MNFLRWVGKPRPKLWSLIVCALVAFGALATWIALIFDEATSNLDQQTVEQFAHTVNQLKGKVTMLFVTHQLPRGLAVDDGIYA